MITKQIPAIISFELVEHGIKDRDGNHLPPLVWNNVPAMIDFYDNRINCEIAINLIELMALSDPQITALSIRYSDSDYAVDVNKCNILLFSTSSCTYDCTRNTLERKRVTISFSFKKSILSLIPHDKDRVYSLVFSGACKEPFEMEQQYKGQNFCFSSPKDCDLLTVSSDTVFPKDTWALIIMSFSLFQNAEIRLLETHTPDDFQLYIQLPPPPGTHLCTHKNIFSLIWDWLAVDDNFLQQRNMLEFFFAGARNREGYIDFRLINLFVCINSICGGTGQFGVNIANRFRISEGDGHWLAYVRNRMVHEGASIAEAIDGAFADFNDKQVPRGLTLSRYAAYQTTTEPREKLIFALYCDVIDLIMAYFMRTIGCSQRISEMRAIYGAFVK